MSIIFRRITYLSFFLLFFLVSPLLIFYSLGYRYNFDKKIIEKNGAFFIKSYPRSASIYIDNKKTKYKTPAQVTNIKPGIHLVEIKKDDLTTWRKQLTVQAGETTFIEDVALLLAEPIVADLGPGAENYLVNKDNDKYSYIENNILHLVNTEQNKLFEVYEFNTPTELIDWSKNDQKMIIKQDTYKLFDLSQQKITPLEIINPEQILFDNQDENLIWFLKSRKLYKHNLILNNIALKAEDVSNFELTGDYLILQNNQKSSAEIKQVHKENNLEIRNINDLNLGKLKVLLGDQEYLIFMLGSRLYIQRQSEELIIVPASFVEIYGKFLLINDGYQTILYDYNDNYKEIIDRSSQIVSEIKWHPNGSYFINEVNGVTTIYELDGRDYRNNLQLLNDPLKKMYLFNKKGDKLFVLTEEKNFSIQIQ